MIEWVWNLGSSIVRGAVGILVGYAQRHPEAVVLLALAIIRSFGTTVRSGWAGVLFSFGRAKKVLEPGFHPLLPVVQKVRHLPVRSVTLDLPGQYITTADGLVYEVHCNIVYRAENPILVVTAIDDAQRGVMTLVPMLVHELMREQTRQSLADRSALDQELTTRAREALARWGLTVEQAGMSTIAPTPMTLRLTQLPARVAERTRLFDQLGAGQDASLALALFAAGRAPMGRSSARYRRHRATRIFGALQPARLTLILPQPALVRVNGNAIQAVGTQTFLTPDLERDRKYVYTIEVERDVAGWPVIDTREIKVLAGKDVTADFTKPAQPGEAKAAE